jgi:hypothetical protein
MSVRTGLPDHTMQTKFQSQGPSDVETPVPSIWVQKLGSIGTVSTWMGDRLSPRKKLISYCWLPVLYPPWLYHREELIQCLALRQHPLTSATNKHVLAGEIKSSWKFNSLKKIISNFIFKNYYFLTVQHQLCTVVETRNWYWIYFSGNEKKIV